jgi:uncharacterized damage-inducible protein DinB
MIMSETPQQYSERIMKMIAGKDPFKTQSATPQKLARLVKSAPPSKLRKRPAPEKWSVAEILAHLADANLAIYKSLSPDQWKHFGMHAERGEESLTRILHMMAGHDLNHISQIEQILLKKK